MARNKRFNRQQLRDLKRQIKDSREKAVLEQFKSEEEKEKALEDIKNTDVKKDKLGFSREDRKNINEKMSSLEKSGPKLTWNFDVGSLVYIPSGEVGLIVRNEAQDVEIKYHDYDMKKVINSSGKYAGQVYVVTSAGNNWYYPRQLKIVRDN